MDELIIRAIEGHATPEELEELNRWRDASRDHEERYREIQAVWALTSVRQELDTEREVPSARTLLQPTVVPPKAERRHEVRRWLRPAMAAAIALLLGVGIAHLATTPGSPDGSTVAEFRAGSVEPTTAVLEDGTIVRLAPDSRLEVALGDDARSVQLEGRAYFVVAHDPDKPFEVRTRNGDVRVLGTRFEVDARRNEFRLLVVDGRVALTAGGTEAELGAGELGRATAGSPPSVTRVDTPEALLDWMGAWVAFESTPLHRVARELEVRLGVRIQIVDPSIAERTVSGWFAEEDREDIVDMICRVADVRCTADGAQVLVEGES